MARSEIDNREVIEIRSQSDVVLVRQAGRAMVRDMGFGTAQQTRLATAISELVRNVLNYAGGGRCYLIDSSDDHYIKIRSISKIKDRG